MLRITTYLKEIFDSKCGFDHCDSVVLNQVKESKKQKLISNVKPVVIWNLTRQCNLSCKHCYTNSTNKTYPNELNLKQIFTVLNDLWGYGVKFLIISGGEPMLHPHIMEILLKASKMGFYLGLSTNGSLIDHEVAGRLKDLNLNYVGISLDGIGETHDQFRRQNGAFESAIRGIRSSLDHHLKVGIRYCLTQDTYPDFKEMFDLMEREGIDKFYLSHLNYSGRGNLNKSMDAFHEMTRQALIFLFEKSIHYLNNKKPFEVVTGNNDADGPFLYFYVKKYFSESAAQRLLKQLEKWGGNSTGIGIANIGPNGEVHPDSFWGNYNLGNIKTRPFSEIWEDLSDPVLLGLRQKPRNISGRCAFCAYFTICGGNTRLRAYQLTGDYWSEDPGCYLTDQEIDSNGIRG